jgi:hypothetical protein
MAMFLLPAGELVNDHNDGVYIASLVGALFCR